MKWNETIASDVRYSHILAKIIGDWEILWEDSESDYQGHCAVLAKNKVYYNRTEYFFYEYSHGSCSGCDSWESDDLSEAKILKEMINTALWFDNKEELANWLEMLEESKLSIKWDDDRKKMDSRIEAIKNELAE